LASFVVDDEERRARGVHRDRVRASSNVDLFDQAAGTATGLVIETRRLPAARGPEIAIVGHRRLRAQHDDRDVPRVGAALSAAWWAFPKPSIPGRPRSIRIQVRQVPSGASITRLFTIRRRGNRGVYPLRSRRRRARCVAASVQLSSTIQLPLASIAPPVRDSCEAAGDGFLGRRRRTSSGQANGEAGPPGQGRPFHRHVLRPSAGRKARTTIASPRPGAPRTCASVVTSGLRVKRVRTPWAGLFRRHPDAGIRHGPVRSTDGLAEGLACPRPRQWRRRGVNLAAIAQEVEHDSDPVFMESAYIVPKFIRCSGTVRAVVSFCWTSGPTVSNQSRRSSARTSKCFQRQRHLARLDLRQVARMPLISLQEDAGRPTGSA